MLEQVVRDSLGQTSTTEKDAATEELALTYARAIDQGDADLAKLGPALLACLESLLMTPRARAAAKKAVTSEQPAANPLDQLADRRLRRGRAEAVDAVAP